MHGFLPKIPSKIPTSLALPILLILATSLSVFYFVFTIRLNSQNSILAQAKSTLEKELEVTKADFIALKGTDQVKRNDTLQKEISNIQKTYLSAMTTYEKLLDAGKLGKTDKLNEDFAKVLKLLSDKNYATASSVLAELNKGLETAQAKAATEFKVPVNLPESSQPPASGYSRQKVNTDSGSFMVDIISADLNSTRVIVDTASDSDCGNDCHVLSLAEYVSRNGAFAGINGSFFCPAAYPSCAGKTNSFDTLLMNKNKKYFNSDNNVYSVVPAVIFGGNWARFIGRSLEWGRDTEVDAVIANYPLLVTGGQSNFSGSDDGKLTSRGARTFIGATRSNVYIGIVHNATSAEAAKVLQTMGMENALGLDQGGSTALWYNGYKSGPGRGIPNAILFIRR